MLQIAYFDIKEELKIKAKENNIKLEDIVEFIKLDLHFKTNKEAMAEVKKSEMIILKDRKCLFYPENNIRIRYNRNNFMVYESFFKEEDTYFSLNVINLISVIEDMSYYKAVDFIIKNCEIKTEEQQWIEQEKAKYKNNLKRLYELEGGYWGEVFQGENLVGKIYKYAEDRIIGWDSSIDLQDKKYSLFKVSAKYLSYFVNIERTKITRLLMLFCYFGIIQKVNNNNFIKGCKKETGIYYIPEYTDEKIQEIKDRIDYYLKSGLKSYRITKGAIEQLELGFCDEHQQYMNNEDIDFLDDLLSIDDIFSYDEQEETEDIDYLLGSKEGMAKIYNAVLSQIPEDTVGGNND